MTWCHHYQITRKSQAHSRGPQCDGLQSNKQNDHCIRRCSNRSVKWFIPHADLFATHLNYKVPLYVSPVQEQHAWDIDALNMIWSGLTAKAYPPLALFHRVIIIVIPPGKPEMPWFWDLVQLSLQRCHSTYMCHQHFSNSPTTKCFKAINNISTSTPDV